MSKDPPHEPERNILIMHTRAPTGAASGPDAIADALTKLLDFVEDNEGLPTTKLTTELVDAMRAKRGPILGDSQQWNGVTEEAYNRLMRKVDPWRVTEIQPVAQRSMLLFGPVYIALLAVQQVSVQRVRCPHGALRTHGTRCPSLVMTCALAPPMSSV